MTIDFLKYSDLLARSESSNNPKAVNNIGALGLFQFLPKTLNSLQSLYNLPAWKNESNFLNNVELQKTYLRALVTDTLNFIRSNNLDRYLNTLVIGSKKYPGLKANLNTYGMLAIAHLGGSANLKKFLESSGIFNPSDGATTLSDYGAYFSSKLSSSSSFQVLLAFIPGIVLYYL